MDEVNAKTTIEEMNQYASWSKPSKSIVLDGDYTAHELEALVWWMNHKAMVGYNSQLDMQEIA
jgi:hypothetical protein